MVGGESAGGGMAAALGMHSGTFPQRFESLVDAYNDYGFVTCFTSVAATLNNTGPGLGAVGPVGNYAMFSPLSKSVLIFDMPAGRLELFPVLLLFIPAAWKKS